jgi:tricorn protease
VVYNKRGAPVKLGDGLLKMAGAEVYIDPRAEWKQMYKEVWRIERDFFYDPHFHGLNLKAAASFYAPWLDRLGSRSELNYLFEEMLGNLNVSHLYADGRLSPKVKHVNVGLLGADYRIENNRYRFEKVFDGENWNPDLQAPLTQPGVNVTAGEYLLAVNGRDLHATDNLYSFFQEKAGQQTVLRVGPNSDGSGARQVTVLPTADESGLRYRDWIEENRRYAEAALHMSISPILT